MSSFFSTLQNMDNLSTRLQKLSVGDLSAARISLKTIPEKERECLEEIEFLKCLEQKNDPLVHDTYYYSKTRGTYGWVKK